ncbi:MAG: hypothetical protein EA370_02365 [Wenzhouxiangella sp.]|nr:MAG: hypothetical protein EA370_02365 [Wenzhouxiangella sp.]
MERARRNRIRRRRRRNRHIRGLISRLSAAPAGGSVPFLDLARPEQSSKTNDIDHDRDCD